MKLVELTAGDLIQGRLVVLLPAPGAGDIPQLRLVERVETHLVFLEPTAMFLDDDEVSETFSFTEAMRRLRLPVIESGDPVFYRTRPARVCKAMANDFHVYVEFQDSPGQEHYTNLIHLDFTPSLLAFAE